LGWLIRIGRGTERNGQSLVLGGAKLGPQKLWRGHLGEDLPLKVRAVPHFHKLVGITGIAVLAPKLAPSVGVDGPDKGHAAAGLAVERGARREDKKLDLGPLANLWARGRQARDANQPPALLGSGRGGLHRNLSKSGLRYFRFLFAICQQRFLATRRAIDGQRSARLLRVPSYG